LQSDRELVASVLAGRTEDFAVLVSRYERLVRSVLLTRLRDRHAVEDAAQEAFLAAFRSLPTLRQPESFGAWLLGIAKHQAGRLRRDLPVRMEPLEMFDAVDADDAKRQADGERLGELLTLIERLPDHERAAVGLRHFAGHSAVEISAITGRPVGTVTKQLSRAYARLKRWVEMEVRS
jgi:RNA polymerase sigma-70 factor (ECF subfamily)